MWVTAARSSGWLRPLVASVTRQVALNQIGDSDFEGRARRVPACEDRAVMKEINGAVGRVACYQHMLCGEMCSLLKSWDCLSGTRGQTLSAACRALDSLILSYSFPYTLSLTFLSPPDFKSFVTILSVLLLHFVA